MEGESVAEAWSPPSDRIKEVRWLMWLSDENRVRCYAFDRNLGDSAIAMRKILDDRDSFEAEASCLREAMELARGLIETASSRARILKARDVLFAALNNKQEPTA
jgi:hypothetical protein